MQLIIGLGNPGKTYEKTRHNMGFLVVDAYARDLGTETFSQQSNCSAKCTHIGSVRLAKPTTFMNESGIAAQKLISYFHIDTKNLLIIHDELDLPFGDMRLQFDRGSAGHNGVSSIATHLGTSSFWRLRIGIAPEQKDNMNPEHFVVSHFSKEEEKQLPDIITRAVAALRMIQTDGTEKTVQFLHT
ncbi:MAG: aminoacyl-tRNA hydrolase [Patescibacteria group bacterium]